MTSIGWFLAGFFTPFAAAAALLAGLLARDAWERHRQARRQRPPKSLLERWQRTDVLTVEDLEHLDQWERELATGADA